MKIAVIDYGAGNLCSIANMLDNFDCDYELTSDEKKILSADKIIFPGQGHFAQAMRNLDEKGLVPVIKESINSGKYFLGVCLGLQVLFEKSEEALGVDGLGVFRGEVLKFREGKIPQIGWNKLRTTSNNRVLSDDYFYFVNSYYVKPEDESIVSAYCSYYIDFAASVEKDNIFAMQFHPEKSARAGYDVFRKWIEL